MFVIFIFLVMSNNSDVEKNNFQASNFDFFGIKPYSLMTIAF